MSDYLSQQAFEWRLRSEATALSTQLRRAETLIAHLASWRDRQGNVHDLTNPEAQVQTIIDKLETAERERDEKDEACKALAQCASEWATQTHALEYRLATLEAVAKAARQLQPKLLGKELLPNTPGGFPDAVEGVFMPLLMALAALQPREPEAPAPERHTCPVGCMADHPTSLHAPYVALEAQAEAEGRVYRETEPAVERKDGGE